MKTILLLTAFLTAFSVRTASAQLSQPQLPKGVGITAGLWNTRHQTGSALSIDIPEFGLDLALHQEFLSDLKPHATSIVGGHANKTEHWLTFARAGVVYNWETQQPGLTAETGLSWRLHDKFALSFVLHGDVSGVGLMAGSRFGIQTHF